MIKLQTSRAKTGDDFSLTNSILTINNIDYDLNNLNYLSEGDTETRCYLQDDKKFDEDGNEISSTTHIIIRLIVDKTKAFMFYLGNAKRFYDIDCDGILNISELAILIDDYNANEETCRANRKKIRDTFLNNKKSEGLTMSEAVKVWEDKGK